MCAGAVNDFSQLVACRSLLGIFESVFGCGAPYFLSLFYQRNELGFRISLLTGMSPIANCFASTLAYGITQIKGSLKPWRYLFIIGKFVLLLDISNTNDYQRVRRRSCSPLWSSSSSQIPQEVPNFWTRPSRPRPWSVCKPLIGRQRANCNGSKLSVVCWTTKTMST